MADAVDRFFLTFNLPARLRHFSTLGTSLYWLNRAYIRWYAAKETDIPAGMLVHAHEDQIVGCHIHLNDRVLPVGRVDCQLQRYLILSREAADTHFFIGVFASLIDRSQETAGVGKINRPVVFDAHVSIRHLSHAAQDVDAGVAPQDLHVH